MRLFLLVLFLIIPLLTRLFFYYDARPVYQDGDIYKKTYSLMHEPRRNDRSQYFFVDGILVSAPLYPKYYYADVLEVSGVVKETTSEKGVLLSLKDAVIKRKENENPLLNFSKFVRERAEESVIRVLPEKQAGLFLGIILGVRDKIERNFYEDLRNVGILHIVAASGQNVSILAAVMLFLLQKAVKRNYVIFFTALGIFFYALLSGFDPPIVRAGVMAIVTFGATVVGRQASGMVALLATSYTMVFLSPGLLEDISFQLSFLSTFGILNLKPFFDFLLKSKWLVYVKEDLTTTLSAQVTTLPILLGVFGSYSLISLPVNVMILWTIPIVMIVGGAGVLLSVLVPIISYPFILLTYPFLYFMTITVDIFSNIPAAFSVANMPQTLIFGYYLIMFGIVILIRKRERRKI